MPWGEGRLFSYEDLLMKAQGCSSRNPVFLNDSGSLLGKMLKGIILSVSSETPEWVMTDVLLKSKAVPLNFYVSPSAGLWLLHCHCAGDSIAQCSLTPGRGLQHKARLPQLKNSEPEKPNPAEF